MGSNFWGTLYIYGSNLLVSVQTISKILFHVLILHFEKSWSTTSNSRHFLIFLIYIYIYNAKVIRRHPFIARLAKIFRDVKNRTFKFDDFSYTTCQGTQRHCNENFSVSSSFVCAINSSVSKAFDSEFRRPGIGPSHGCGTNVIFLILSCTFSALHRWSTWKTHSLHHPLRHPVITWWSGYCHLNKGECDLNQSKDDSFVKWVAKNNNWNNGDRHKIHEISWLIVLFSL